MVCKLRLTISGKQFAGELEIAVVVAVVAEHQVDVNRSLPR
jgi:hypothetical protein